MADPDDEKGGSQIVPDGPGRPDPKPADTPTPDEDAGDSRHEKPDD